MLGTFLFLLNIWCGEAPVKGWIFLNPKQHELVHGVMKLEMELELELELDLELLGYEGWAGPHSQPTVTTNKVTGGRCG